MEPSVLQRPMVGTLLTQDRWGREQEDGTQGPRYSLEGPELPTDPAARPRVILEFTQSPQGERWSQSRPSARSMGKDCFAFRTETLLQNSSEFVNASFFI